MSYPLSLNPDHAKETALGSDGRTHALAAYDRPNEGGTLSLESGTAVNEAAPRLVTRGESSWHEITGEDGESYIAFLKNGRAHLVHLPKPKVDGVASAAIVDYLNCTFPFSIKDSLVDFFSELLGIIGQAFAPVIDRKVNRP